MHIIERVFNGTGSPPQVSHKSAQGSDGDQDRGWVSNSWQTVLNKIGWQSYQGRSAALSTCDKPGDVCGTVGGNGVRYDLAASVGWTSIKIEALAAATALPELRSACNYAAQTAGRSGWSSGEARGILRVLLAAMQVPHRGLCCELAKPCGRARTGMQGGTVLDGQPASSGSGRTAYWGRMADKRDSCIPSCPAHARMHASPGFPRCDRCADRSPPGWLSHGASGINERRLLITRLTLLCALGDHGILQTASH